MQIICMFELNKAFCSKFDYEFSDTGLLELAFTHRSFAKVNNERLEFLGDSLLNCTITTELYKRHPNLNEGDLSRLRSSLVDKDSLAILANQYDVGSFLRLGTGELKTGGRRRDSTLADTMEAIFGAVYLDSNIDRVQMFIAQIYDTLLQSPPDIEELKDPKTRLQEFLQSRKLPIPEYAVVNVTGKPHEQQFTVMCNTSEYNISMSAAGGSRRKAEQSAAQLVLNKLYQLTEATNE